LASWLFSKALSLIYLSAFVSFAVQARGLIGENGILPASRYLEILNQHYGSERLTMAPTIFHFGSTSDSFIVGACWTGALLSVLAFFGIAQSISFLLMFVLYLSLINISQDFLSFQWDILLVECGFLAVFLAPFIPLHLNPLNGFFETYTMPVFLKYLFLFLLFRLMFSSGAVKLSSGDETWKSLTALRFHYETQPLPNPLAWFAHQQPLSFQKFAAFVMFVIELGLPFLIWGPQKTKLIAFAGFVTLQVLILATGNYAFFNVLSIALCFFLLDDSVIQKIFPAFSARLTILESPVYLNYVTGAVFVFLVPLGLCWLIQSVYPQWMRQPLIQRIVEPFYPFHLVNPYGLFAVMTTTRPEIIIEGSNDGFDWREYQFKHKVGRPEKRPTFVAPHQPRLDWQMWFAALGDYQRNPWFQNLLTKLLEGEKTVLALLANNPFENKAPKYIRARLYDYKFSPRRAKGWWTRTYVKEYSPILALRETEVQ
jgi:lipase maturation factor 1